VGPLDYGFTYWPDKFRVSGKYQSTRFFSTGYYGFTLDVLKMSIKNLGMLQEKSIDQQMASDNYISNLAAASVTYGIKINGGDMIAAN